MICLLLLCLGLMLTSNAFSSENVKCKMQHEVRWASRLDVSEKKIRELNRIYGWCVNGFACKSGDMKILLEFLEEKCEFQGISEEYAANPETLKMEAYRILKKHDYVFNR